MAAGSALALPTEKAYRQTEGKDHLRVPGRTFDGALDLDGSVDSCGADTSGRGGRRCRRRSEGFFLLLHSLPPDRRDREERRRAEAEWPFRPAGWIYRRLQLFVRQQEFRHRLGRSDVSRVHQGAESENPRYQDGFPRPQDPKGNRRHCCFPRPIRRRRKEEITGSAPTVSARPLLTTTVVVPKILVSAG